jgi:hypothetical protein
MIHEEPAKYDLWLKLLLAGAVLFAFFLGLFLVTEDPTGSWVSFGTVAFEILLFHSVLPRRFQIYNDRLRIVLGRPFAVTLALANISEARPISGIKALSYWGIRLATSASTAVLLVRRRGWNIVISPADRERFLQRLDIALRQTR